MIQLSKIDSHSPHKIGLLFAILGAILYGIYPPAARAVYQDGANAALVIIFMTFARGLSMALFCLRSRLPMFQTHDDCKQALIGGAFQACTTGSIFLSLLYIPGPLTIMIVFMHTLMLLFFMAARGEIKLNAVNISTTIVALLGLTLVLDVWQPQPGSHWIGMGLAFFAAIMCVGRQHAYGAQTATRNPIVVGAENFLVAAAITCVALFFEMPRLPQTLTGLFYLIVTCASVVLATFSMFFGIAILGAFQYSLMAKLEPLFTSLFSVLFLKEILSLSQYFGMALLIGSLAAYQLLSRGNKALKESALPAPE